MESPCDSANSHRRVRSADWKPKRDPVGDRRPSEPFVPTRANTQSKKSGRPSAIDPSTANNVGVVDFAKPSDPAPVQTTDSVDLSVPAPSSPHFHNYLRALHPFDPQSSAVSAEDASLLTASLKPGDLILVHCVHANGWADGTVLNTGDRGWLPTNYCEAYDHPYLRNLLGALTLFWDLLAGNEEVDLSSFVRQDYIRGLIAGVRYLLERADCLHRDAALVAQYVGVRRMRKGLLSDLSALVQIAKRLQDTANDPYAEDAQNILLDDLVAKAFKVATRAASFLDVWSQETSAARKITKRIVVARERSLPSTSSDALEVDTKLCVGESEKQPIDSAKCFDCQRSDNPDTAGIVHEPETIDEAPPRPSMVFTPPGGLAVHRLSLVTKSTNAVSGPLASEQLAKAHDICISHIGAFIGHHLHSRPCSELVATTEKLVKACRTLLAIVDEVCSHHTDGSMSVQQARQDFEQKLENLSTSAKDVFKFSDSPEDDMVMLPEQSTHLISVGTGLIRNTGECVVKTRRLIETIGDFELKQSVVASPTTYETLVIAEQAPSHELQRRPTSSQARDSLEKTSSKVMMTRTSTNTTLQPTVTAEPESFVMVSSSDSLESVAFATPQMQKPLPPVPLTARRNRSATRTSQASNSVVESFQSSSSYRSHSTSPVRKDSAGMSITSSTDTFISVTRNSTTTAVSQTSTRATTPDQQKEPSSPEFSLTTSFASISSLRSMATDTSGDGEAQLLQKTYANELTFSKDGQITGGSLPALVERLTMHDAAPDPQFVTAFFLTFRKFTEPRELAQALIARYDYIGDGRTVGTPVRLRIYNVCKGWLETYWNAEADKDALGEIRYLALHKLKHHLPGAGDRLIELTRRVTAAYSNGTIAGPLVSGVGKTSMSIGPQQDNPADAPESVASKNQLNSLRLANGGGSPCSIHDFDPLELARQITLIAMKTYSEIQSDELVSMDWGKSNTKKARNVRNMCQLNTDLAHVVGDTILAPEDAKKRAQVIKQWAKIAMHCLELNNYDSIMAIMCSINSSVVQRLKRTWEFVSKKTRARLEELEHIIDIRKNYSTLRRRLETPTAPCLPFLGVYLTDLTFVMAGNPKRRDLPGSASDNGDAVSVINFDMYMRLAKIVSHLQKYQVPYNLRVVPEMQLWMKDHMSRMRASHDHIVALLHKRSLLLEPKSDKNSGRQHVTIDTKRLDPMGGKSEPVSATASSGASVVEKFDNFWNTRPFLLRTSSSRQDLQHAAALAAADVPEIPRAANVA